MKNLETLSISELVFITDALNNPVIPDNHPIRQIVIDTFGEFSMTGVVVIGCQIAQEYSRRIHSGQLVELKPIL